MARDDINLDELLLEAPLGYETAPDIAPETEYDDLEAGDLEADDLEADDLEADDSFGTGESSSGDVADGIGHRETEALAFELMGLGSGAEMDEFLGRIFRGVGKRLRRVAKKALPHAVSFLKGPGAMLLAKALPLVGTAAGSLVPGLGNVVGAAAGRMVGQCLQGDDNGGDTGAQLDSMMGEMGYNDLEEAKMDVATRVVRTIADAAGQAATDPNATTNPAVVARTALSGAMDRHLPGAIRQALARTGPQRGAKTGRWIRKGNRIILLGV
ncbi:MAG: hypothetical protein ACKVZ0_16185 [Gemmatimonadales bacterium]